MTWGGGNIGCSHQAELCRRGHGLSLLDGQELPCVCWGRVLPGRRGRESSFPDLRGACMVQDQREGGEAGPGEGGRREEMHLAASWSLRKGQGFILWVVLCQGLPG